MGLRRQVSGAVGRLDLERGRVGNMPNRIMFVSNDGNGNATANIAAPHGLLSGNAVILSGTGGVVVYDGLWYVTVVSSTQFALVNPSDAATAAAYIGPASGGTWKKVTVTRYAAGVHAGIVIPSGATVLGWGAGGGGGSVYGAGSAGGFAQTTLTAGNTFTVTVGAGGSGPAGDGSDSVVTDGTHTLTAAAGQSGDGVLNNGDTHGGLGSVNFGTGQITHHGGNGGAFDTHGDGSGPGLGVGAGSAGPHGDGFDGEFVFAGHASLDRVGNGASDVIGPDINGANDLGNDTTPAPTGARYIGGTGGVQDGNGNFPGGGGGFQTGGTPTAGSDGLVLVAV
jgi:hypothetical protein